MQEVQFGKITVDGIKNELPFTYINRSKTVSFENADPEIMMSYNQLRYLSGMIKAMCQYHKNSRVVRIGNCSVIKDTAPKDIKISKIKMRL